MIKGILFDKDGTLVEFNSLWVESTYAMIHSIAKEFLREENNGEVQKIARLLGLDGNDVKEDGLLAGHTSEDLAIVIAEAFQLDKNMIHEKIDAFFYEEVVKKSDNIKAVGDLVALFGKLKKHQLTIGIVTADNLDVTQFTLDKLGIAEYIDFIATADQYKKKPNKEAMEVFCNKFNLQKDEVIHIGDTMVDMEFSKHGLLGIGVLSGVGSEETLRKSTPYIIKTVDDLFDSEGRFLFVEYL